MRTRERGKEKRIEDREGLGLREEEGNWRVNEGRKEGREGGREGGKDMLFVVIFFFFIFIYSSSLVKRWELFFVSSCFVHLFACLLLLLFFW